MRETSFIEQNKNKWAECEELISKDQTDPDKLSNLFVQVTDDLSYSRSFYPSRSVRYYLNYLAQSIFYNIYKNRRNRRKRFVAFWKEDLPAIVYQCRKELMLSLIVFIFSVTIGVVSSVYDPEFTSVILGDDYVEMTNENIENSNPMGVYQDSSESSMFFMITLNNIRVDFLTFILGLIASIGSILVVLYNGIMVGTFQYFFYERGVFIESFLTIWLHGTLEMSAMIIAGGAGITLGKGLLFPGTYTRLQSFQISARRGLKLLISILPLTIFASIIESFATRYTGVPTLLKAGIIIASLIFVIAYFVWYPISMHRKRGAEEKHDTAIPATKNFKTDTTNILNHGEILFATFMLYKKFFGKIFLLTLGSVIGFTFYAYSIDLHKQIVINVDDMFANLFFFFKLFQYDSSVTQLLVTSGILSIVLFLTGRLLLKEFDVFPKTFGKIFLLNLKVFFVTFFLVTALNFLLLKGNGFLVLVYFALTPIVLTAIFISIYEKKNLIAAVQSSFSLVTHSIMYAYGLFFTILIMSLFYQLIINSPLLYIYIDFVNWNLSLSEQTMETLVQITSVIITVLTFCLILPLFFISAGVQYFSLREIKEANHLTERIQKIGLKKRSYGFEE